MGNVIDYLVQYGDQAFAERAFCDVDVLILAQLSYFDFGSAVPTIAQRKKSVTLEEIETPALAAFIYRAAASISTAFTPHLPSSMFFSK